MPLTNYAFADLITFTRSTTATFVGSNGLIQSAAINAPRFDFDPVTLAPFGLLIEEQRVNLLLYSEQFDNAGWTKTNGTITANATTAPDGTLTGDKHVPNLAATLGTGVTQTRVQQGPSVTTGTSYTFTIYAKAGEFDRIEFALIATPSVSAIFSLTSGTVVSGTGASITPAGNGWYRCTLTAVSGITGALAVRWTAQSSTVLIGDGTSGIFVWGAQFEAGAFPTSYIPTVAATVTRTVDAAAITGAVFTPWFNATEGTFVAQWRQGPISGTRTVVAANDGTSNQTIRLRTVTADPFFTVTNGGVDQANIDAGTVAGSTVYKMASGYRANDFATSIGGGAVGTDTSGTVPTVDQLMLGTSAASNYLNGHLRNITYYPTRLTDAQLQALTA
jgi:hypothetical protein